MYYKTLIVCGRIYSYFYLNIWNSFIIVIVIIIITFILFKRRRTSKIQIIFLNIEANTTKSVCDRAFGWFFITTFEKKNRID